MITYPCSIRGGGGNRRGGRRSMDIALAVCMHMIMDTALKVFVYMIMTARGTFACKHDGSLLFSRHNE